MGVAVGDYNNDGHEDMFVVGVHANYLYRNNGDGTFSDVTRAAGLAGPGSLGRPAWSVWAPAGSTTTTTASLTYSSPTTATGAREPIPSAAECRSGRTPTATLTTIAPSRCSSITTTATAHSPRSPASRALPDVPGEGHGLGHRGFHRRRKAPASSSPTTMRAIFSCATGARGFEEIGSRCRRGL